MPFCAPQTALRRALRAGPLRMLLPALWPRFAGYRCAIAPVYELLLRYRAGLPVIASPVRRYTDCRFPCAPVHRLLSAIAPVYRQCAGSPAEEEPPFCGDEPVAAPFIGHCFASAPVYRLSLPFCGGEPAAAPLSRRRTSTRRRKKSVPTAVIASLFRSLLRLSLPFCAGVPAAAPHTSTRRRKKSVPSAKRAAASPTCPQTRMIL